MWDELSQTCNTGCENSLKTLKNICQFADINLVKGTKPPNYSDKVKWSLVEALLKSNARYSALMITDILDSRERINIPGTVTALNWSYRVDWKFEHIPDIVACEMEKLVTFQNKCD